MTMPEDMRAYNAKLIAEFRRDGGKSMGDRPLLLLTTVGRRTGNRRTSPMMFVRDHGRYLVIASNSGATADPEWYKNLLAHPEVTVEVPGHEFSARATPLEGRDYDREWARIQQNYPFFTEHEQRAGRRIPVVALTEAAG
ncbi:MAG TPA: nitroreductase family deazaflavin-dependent oxidoreductase [Actinoplanes sp.]|nr:nitroreductase family deazaflavin-dependent oxidoreductase [Actinoplanes sp.]